MLKDISSEHSDFPKTVFVRNQMYGAVWQVYHVDNLKQAEIIATNATRNGFKCITLNDKTEDEETWPDWRETDGGKDIIERSLN